MKLVSNRWVPGLFVTLEDQWVFSRLSGTALIHFRHISSRKMIESVIDCRADMLNKLRLVHPVSALFDFCNVKTNI